MAPKLGLGLTVQPWMLFLGVCLALLQGSAAQFCSFWNNGCIDPLAQTAIGFDFHPLFTNPIYLYYGFDASASGKGEGPMTKTGFWLRYQDRHVNKSAIDNNRTSEVAVRVGNLTGVPSGSNNGCDGIWGAECSQDIKTSLQHSIWRLASSGHAYDRPLQWALQHMMQYPPSLPSCPPPVLDVAQIPVQGMCQFDSFCCLDTANRLCRFRCRNNPSAECHRDALGIRLQSLASVVYRPHDGTPASRAGCGWHHQPWSDIQ